MTKTHKAKIDRSLLVPIIADAAMAGRGVADGRLLPVLILDTTGRPEIAELIRVHSHLPSGDVASQWGGRINGDDDSILLSLQFRQPMDVAFVLVFSIEKQAILVEAMLAGGGVYLQAGDDGDRLITTMDASRILVELPEGGFRQIWDKLLLDRMIVVTARRLGLRRRKARASAERLVAEIRRFAALRFPA